MLSNGFQIQNKWKNRIRSYVQSLDNRRCTRISKWTTFFDSQERNWYRTSDCWGNCFVTGLYCIGQALTCNMIVFFLIRLAITFCLLICVLKEKVWRISLVPWTQADCKSEMTLTLIFVRSLFKISSISAFILFRYTQCVAMTRFYKRPILLIEFDPAKSFSLQVCHPKFVLEFQTQI